jgi:hypothetical protein
MDEPTDRALKLQGLTRAQYDSLEPQAKDIIAGRCRKLVDLADITLAAELLNAVVEADETCKMYIRETLDGGHPEFQEKVRDIVKEYIDSGIETSMKEYYKIKYGTAGIIPKAQEQQPTPTPQPESTADRDAQELLGGATPAAHVTSTPTQKPQADAIPRPEPTPQAEAIPRPEPTPQAEAPRKPSGDRGGNIALILSRYEGRDVDSVMKTEGDVIEAIMSVVDDNMALGLTDEGVCKACESMIREEEGVQFYMEALLPEHRASLLDRVKTAKRGI